MKAMLDSGAYSAWTQEQAIDVHDYVAFVKATQHLWDTVINLDVIAGRDATREEFEHYAQRCYDNLRIMKAAGSVPNPCVSPRRGFRLACSNAR